MAILFSRQLEIRSMHYQVVKIRVYYQLAIDGVKSQSTGACVRVEAQNVHVAE